jgi:hypothetical protein
MTEESKSWQSKRRDIEAEITNAIEAAMNEHGTGWIKPFSGLCAIPTNAVTGKEYRGLNALWLGIMGISHAAGYKQWQTIGAQVRKGGKGIGITAPLKRIVKDKKTEDKVLIGFRPATVSSTHLRLTGGSRQSLMTTRLIKPRCSPRLISTLQTLVLASPRTIKAEPATSPRLIRSVCRDGATSPPLTPVTQPSATTQPHCTS